MTLGEARFHAIRDPGRPSRSFPGGWLTDGTFAVKVAERVSVDVVVAPGSEAARKFAELMTKHRLPATERREWRVPGRPRIPGAQCEPCSGTGVRECDLGHEHECKPCKGEGDFGGKREITGQIVVDLPPGRAVVLHGRFVPLFDVGHSICVLHDAQTPVLVLDEAGEPIGLALPMVRVEPVAPADEVKARGGRR